MKKILLALSIVLLFCGCSKEEEKPLPPSYIIRVSEGLIQGLRDMASDKWYDTFETNIVIGEYCNGQRVGANSIKDVKPNHLYRKMANERAEYITVRLDFKYSSYYEEPGTFSTHIAHVIYLNKDEDTYVDFNEETLTTIAEPK